MRTYHDCTACIVKQTIACVRKVTDDPSIQDQLLRETFSMLSNFDYSEPPAVMASRVHARLQELTGESNPYRAEKARSNWFALKLYPWLEARVEEAENQAEMALRYAIAGNIIDLGANTNLRYKEIHEALQHAASAPIHADTQAFFEEAARAKRILYLIDNAGEIVFDKLLIKALGAHKVTAAVRGHPILNDATMIDALATGLSKEVKVIDNGSRAPGTLLSSCSEHFRRTFEEADMVVAKGQGNYESLNQVNKSIFFIMKVKCEVVAKDLGLEVGDIVLHNKTEI